MSAQKRENSDYKSTTCTQTLPQSNLHILCKCTTSKPFNGHNGVADEHCTEMNCINRSETTTNGYTSESSNKTRYKVFGLFNSVQREKTIIDEEFIDFVS